MMKNGFIIGLLAFLLVGTFGAMADELPDIISTVTFGDINRVKSILDKYPHLISETGDYGQTALHQASAYGHLDIARYLI